MRSMKIVAVLACVNPLISGCAGTRSDGAAPLTVSEAKTAIMAVRSKAWKDPDSIRDAQIGQPESCIAPIEYVSSAPHTCVCVMANARNSFGGYTGLKGEVALFGSDRTLIEVISPRSQDCRGSLTPWPEFNGRR